MKKLINVVCAVIEDNDKYLCVQRSNAMTLPLKWEFPGGKVEIHEDHESALIREIREELDCTIEIKEYFVTSQYEYDFGIVNLHAYFCGITKGIPVLSEHKELSWVTKERLRLLDWAAADIPVIKAIEERYSSNGSSE